MGSFHPAVPMWLGSLAITSCRHIFVFIPVAVHEARVRCDRPQAESCRERELSQGLRGSSNRCFSVEVLIVISDLACAHVRGGI